MFIKTHNNGLVNANKLRMIYTQESRGCYELIGCFDHKEDVKVVLGTFSTKANVDEEFDRLFRAFKKELNSIDLRRDKDINL